ncbi:apolipoprotein A-IV-like isoform X2 [Dermochelys coriacea]|uniref:apolipoprotein A-IV-like isoform X2 n=1 Tax=Dermochelys coriacea TaxID=27794 RepID=UPI001CAA04A0|nr:apolipoprotein A-IV-like isoform X2 [Dermochelys coriacea]
MCAHSLGLWCHKNSLFVCCYSKGRRNLFNFHPTPQRNHPWSRPAAVEVLRETPSMKLLIAVLSLAVLGSQASPLSKKPRPKLDQITDAIPRYLEQLITTIVELIQKSELGQEIEQWRLARKIENIFDDLEHKVPPKAQEQLMNLSRQVDVLVEASVAELRELVRKLQPYKKQLHAVLVSYTEGLLERAEQYSKTLLVRQAYSFILSRVELQEKLGSYVQELGLQEFQHGLAAYARDLYQKLSPYAEDLHGWLNSHWDAFMQCFSEETSGGAAS